VAAASIAMRAASSYEQGELLSFKAREVLFAKLAMTRGAFCSRCRRTGRRAAQR